MADSVRITVAIPVYNREDCIGRCIDSVLNQSVKPFEILVVDDGSTDNTPQIIRDFSQKHDTVKHFIAPANGGENYARNRCIQYANGNYIFWLDSDDYIVEDAIETVLQTIAKHSEFQHFMFLTSDRVEGFAVSDNFSKDTHVTTFEDWLTERVYGDFTHVMFKELFEGLPFFEDIRGFPGINFLRVHRKTKKQFFLNKLVTLRERNRADALSLTGYLSSAWAITEKFNNENHFIDHFKDDLYLNSPQLLENKVKRNILLGVSIGKYERNKVLLNILKEKNINLGIYSIINNALFKKPVYFVITSYVKLKKNVIKQ